MKPRSRPRPGPVPELPMDVAEAAGGFGLLSGALSVLLPYFLGLVVALSILGAGVGIVRLFGSSDPGATGPRVAVAALAPLAIGWALFLAAPGPLARARGLALGLASVPLWLTVRRRRPFGGNG